jgi:hypothetical protein
VGAGAQGGSKTTTGSFVLVSVAATVLPERLRVSDMMRCVADAAVLAEWVLVAVWNDSVEPLPISSTASSPRFSLLAKDIRHSTAPTLLFFGFLRMARHNLTTRTMKRRVIIAPALAIATILCFEDSSWVARGESMLWSSFGPRGPAEADSGLAARAGVGLEIALVCQGKMPYVISWGKVCAAASWLALSTRRLAARAAQ